MIGQIWTRQDRKAGYRSIEPSIHTTHDCTPTGLPTLPTIPTLPYPAQYNKICEPPNPIPQLIRSPPLPSSPEYPRPSPRENHKGGIYKN